MLPFTRHQCGNGGRLRYSLALETRARSPIKNEVYVGPVTLQMTAMVATYRAKYCRAFHRSVGPCETFNCHGLTFAARRTHVDSIHVRDTLRDDDYDQIAASDIEPGDIVLYVHSATGEVDHSGLIVEVLETDLGAGRKLKVPKILSKWGNLHEVVHTLDDSPYENPKFEYYRLAR